MSSHVSGAAYVAAMDRDPTNHGYRRAFQALAASLVPAGGTIFDFGSGPGIDARHYAESGLRVGTFDIDAGMREYFVAHCAEQLAAGAVRHNPITYAEFLEARPLQGGSDVDLVAANFAPINLVADLPPLFARFAGMLRPDGKLLLSVLNPLLGRSLRKLSWWARSPRLLLQGRTTSLLHGVTPVTRWLPSRLVAQAHGGFELEAVYVPGRSGAPAQRVSLRRPAHWPRIMASEFLFLQLRRRVGR